MEYRVVGNRCAVDLEALMLPFEAAKILNALVLLGFQGVRVDLSVLARGAVGKSIYRRAAKPSQAPQIVDCSSFTKWLYGQRGIWLPRRPIQQREYGEVVEIGNIVAGDLVFTTGARNLYVNDPMDGVGHVGVATGDHTVIHAASQNVGVVEVSLEKFVGRDKFRGVRRYIPLGREIITFEIPPDRWCVETSDDIRWIVLRTLGNTL